VFLPLGETGVVVLRAALFAGMIERRVSWAAVVAAWQDQRKHKT
jgi:hypothetical protein